MLYIAVKLEIIIVYVKNKLGLYYTNTVGEEG